MTLSVIAQFVEDLFLATLIAFWIVCGVALAVHVLRCVFDPNYPGARK
ncbi:hypothetical protein [Nioella sp.]